MDRTLVSIFGGLSGMFGWGTSDFFANISSEKIGHQKTFFWSQVVGLAAIVLVMLLFHPAVVMTPLLWGLIIFGGIVYAIGYLFFYTGFEIGNISVVSAVVNFQTIFVILISYFFRGQTLSFWQVPAIIFVLVGVTLVSVNFKDFKKGAAILAKGVKETLIATTMFGILFWPTNEYAVEKTDWLFVAMMTKVFAIITVFLLSRFKKQHLIIDTRNRKLLAMVAAVGLFEAAAVLGVNFGIALGDGIIAIPLSSALTIVTVGLAIVFLKEKLSLQQALGITLTVGGIVLSAF